MCVYVCVCLFLPLSQTKVIFILLLTQMILKKFGLDKKRQSSNLKYHIRGMQKMLVAQSAGAVEYTDCFSTVG